MESKPFITYGEIKELMILKGRFEAFKGYVRNTKYSIDRKDAAEMLGFELSEVADAEAGD